ncbi:hypothetical protein PTKIN_Ptkin03bG0083300 [Pterospermum kingtungense]
MEDFNRVKANSILTYNDEDEEELKLVLALHRQQLMDAKTVESDHVFGFHLQMEEAVTAFLSHHHHHPSTSQYITIFPPSDTGFDYLTLMLEDLDRFETERKDMEEKKEEMRKFKDDLNRSIHDQNLPGLISEEWIRDNKVTVGVVGVAVCDFRDNLVFEISKMEGAELISGELVGVEAMIHELHAALSLDLKRVTVFVNDYLVHQYVLLFLHEVACRSQLLNEMVASYPNEGWNSEVTIHSCEKFLDLKLVEIMSHRNKEAFILVSEKVYCAFSRCSALMSKNEVLQYTETYYDMSCYDYKRSNPHPAKEDAMLKPKHSPMEDFNRVKANAILTYNDEDEEELKLVLSLQRQQLMDAKTVESDHVFGFHLQMEEAVTASLSHHHHHPSTSQYITILPPSDTGFDYLTLMLEDLDRYIMDVPEEEWNEYMDNYERPCNGIVVSTESFRVYVKGLISEEWIRDNKVTVGVVGVAVCDFRDNLVFEISKMEGAELMSGELVGVEVVIHGLDAALSLDLKRVTVFVNDYLVHQYVLLFLHEAACRSQLLNEMMARYPHEGYNSEVTIHSCEKFLDPKLVEIMSHRNKEAFILVSEKVYCAFSKCSALMSKNEVLQYTKTSLSLSLSLSIPLTLRPKHSPKEDFDRVKANDILTYKDEDEEELKLVLALQRQQLMDAKTVESDHVFGFHLQMEEAVTASLSHHHHHPSTSQYITILPPSDTGFDYLTLMFEDLDKFETERKDMEEKKKEMRKFKDNCNTKPNLKCVLLSPILNVC